MQFYIKEIVGAEDPKKILSDDAIVQLLKDRNIDVRAADTPDGLRWTLLVRFASSPAAVAAQLDAARELVHGETGAMREGIETRAWAEQVALSWEGDAAVVRCSWLPSRLVEVLALVRALRAECGVVFTGRIGAGSGLLRLTGGDSTVAAVIAQLRLDSSPVGHVVVLRGSRALRSQADVWGTAPSAPAAALKAALDPAGILNAGRGPL